MKAQELTDFEQEIADIYSKGTIRAPVHLRASEDGSYENTLIGAFTQYNISKEDWVFGYWDSHALALLKGVPREEVKQAILDGNSISLCFPEYKVFCSGIVSSLCGVAVGTAWAIKKGFRPSNEHVYIYQGDMGAECGQFMEAYKYASNHELPVTFIIGDNGLSVMTDTQQVWNRDNNVCWILGSDFVNSDNVYYFKYKNKWPHSGLLQKIKF